MNIIEKIKDTGIVQSLLITTGILGIIIIPSLIHTYLKFGRLFPVKIVSIPYDQPIDEGKKIISKCGTHWDDDGTIDEIVTRYQIKKKVNYGDYALGSSVVSEGEAWVSYFVLETPTNSKFYKKR